MDDYNPLIDGHADPANVGSLVSQSLEDSFTETGRRLRHDGWTPERERIFCERLSECGIVADAARAAGMSAQSAYAHRNRAAGRAFHLAWEAALILSRRRLSDELLSRAMNGCIEAIHRDGAIVAEKHRYDNRLSMAVLTRLDRQTEDSRQDASAARVVADEFEQYLDLLATGGEGVRDFIGARQPADAPVPGREEALLARLENYRKYRAGFVAEIDVADLDPAVMEDWTEEQIERADLSGLLARLGRDQWPAAVRAAALEESHGMSQLHQLYRRLNPESIGSADDEFGGRDVWDDEDGNWWTDFPPPAGFDGEEDGEWGDADYKRALAADEQAVVDAWNDEDRADELAGAEAARKRYFGADAGDEPACNDGGSST